MSESFIDYTMSVEGLRRALEKLNPDDRVTVNKVGNLAVYRDDACIGFINVRTFGDTPGEIELFREDDSER